MRECLPVSFLEAAAYKCAILSNNNPDNFAENFGYHAKTEDFGEGLRFLLEGDVWREKADKGFEYVKKTHELSLSIDQHIRIYSELLR